MSWKDWVYENPNGDKKKEPENVQAEAVKFPSGSQPYTVMPQAVVQHTTAQATVVNLAPNVNPACEPHLQNILEVYEKGFDSLNLEGYDFFEFYKAIMVAGVDNPATYPMALSMAQSMDKTVSKEKLVEKSEYYVQEILKVHSGYVEGGTSRKQELLNKKDGERQQLSVDITSLKMQLEAITNQINSAQDGLNNIDAKYANELTEVDCKLMANDVAKDRILVSINKVKQGLINNVK